MTEQYRPLTNSEIEKLTHQSCTCAEWSGIEVANSFKPESVRNVHFAGRWRIGANVRIENVGTLAVSGKSSFGNGIRVSVINEAGGREVPIYKGLTAQTAALIALFRHRPLLIEKLCCLIDDYAESASSQIGYIADGASIVNTGAIINVNIGQAAILNGASRLENGTIDSSASDPAFVGTGVCAKNFITCSGSKIDEYSILHNCFVGQAVCIERQFSAENCLFFANCIASQGEAGSVFAGPYTVTHHKSTLLLAGQFSFFNAGSGTNQSNHLYKLGPVHQGICERGCKTGSNSYLVWPARLGAFSTVIGSHYQHFDTSSMPFSYLIEDNGKSMLVPGTAIKSAGTLRDEHKWPSRDNRKDAKKLDLIIFDVLSPYTMQNVIRGRNQLENILTSLNGTSPEAVQWQNLAIKTAALKNGIAYYNLAITRYLGENLIKRLEHQNLSELAQLRDALTSQIAVGSGPWIDLAGLITPEEALYKIVNDIEIGGLSSLEDIAKSFKTLYDNYTFYQWRWASSLLEDTLATSIEKISSDDIISLLKNYKTSVEKLNSMTLDDARKEFDASAQIGYGTNGDIEIRHSDFEAVHGKFDENKFVKYIRKTTAENIASSDNTIAKLQKIRQ